MSEDHQVRVDKDAQLQVVEPTISVSVGSRFWNWLVVHQQLHLPGVKLELVRLHPLCNVVAMVDSKEDVGQDAQDGRLGGVAWPEAGL